ncbi:MAG: glycosyltransferase [Spirulinaceae cyanobacterium RM2_2_10]|nr:glycosyltransferase [Spirulinaceae cyanobacterium SM2_1_0]NJO20265.1 glycosyltransferase [Spirulinaceae cyanobacterium RM2_2_10]
MLYLITVNYQATDLIRSLLASLAADTTTDWQLVIVNNSPADTAIHQLAGASVVVLEAGENLGFGRGCNLGLQWIWQRQPGAIAWLINPDAWLPAAMLAQAQTFLHAHPLLPILGTQVQEPDGRLWSGAGCFDRQRGAIATATTPEIAVATTPPYETCAWVSGCSLLLNLAGFRDCPQFDPAFFLYYEDFDFCQRYAAQGLAVAYTAHLHVIHRPSSITNRQPAWKLRHSTFGYLLVLWRYASPTAYRWRCTRLLLYALLLLGWKPAAGWGKLRGAIAHWHWRVSHRGQTD